jgi:DNA-binding NtrC family response regulator
MFDVTLCTTIDEARPLLLGERWDAVVSDVQLGDESGLDLFDSVCASRPELASRYVFVSGAANAPEMKARLERTRVPYLQKPFDVEMFRELVVSILAQPVP